MIDLTKLEYGKEIPLGYDYNIRNINNDINHGGRFKGMIWPDIDMVVTIEKTRDENIDRYFIRLRNPLERHTKRQYGYMYFDLDLENRKSSFYGTKTAKSFRNMGVSTLLISTWIKLCIDNGIEDLQTISTQNKPILLYSLKKFSFELLDITKYNEGSNIYICDINNERYMLFENNEQASLFEDGTINRETKHKIIKRRMPTSRDIIVLDKVVLNATYVLKDKVAAYKRAEEKILTFAKR